LRFASGKFFEVDVGQRRELRALAERWKARGDHRVARLLGGFHTRHDDAERAAIQHAVDRAVIAFRHAHPRHQAEVDRA
jgi:hypothetical protein